MIELASITKTYRSRQGDPIHAIEDVSLVMKEKEFVSVVGPSGCGKSTLLKIVAGLVAPTRGVVRIRGTEVHEPFPDVGIVFQSAVLLPWRTVLDNVMFSSRCGLVQTLTATGAMSIHRACRAWGFEPISVGALVRHSQRVAICRALSTTQLLLMTSPSARWTQLRARNVLSCSASGRSAARRSSS